MPLLFAHLGQNGTCTFPRERFGVNFNSARRYKLAHDALLVSVSRDAKTHHIGVDLPELPHGLCACEVLRAHIKIDNRRIEPRPSLQEFQGTFPRVAGFADAAPKVDALRLNFEDHWHHSENHGAIVNNQDPHVRGIPQTSGDFFWGVLRYEALEGLAQIESVIGLLDYVDPPGGLVLKLDEFGWIAGTTDADEFRAQFPQNADEIGSSFGPLFAAKMIVDQGDIKLLLSIFHRCDSLREA